MYKVNNIRIQEMYVSRSRRSRLHYLVANRKEAYFATFLEDFLVTPIHSRLPSSDTLSAIVKGDGGVADVYLVCGSTRLCDS
jgi:hypothetical protein